MMMATAHTQQKGKATEQAQSLLLDYAAGTLDEALSLIVATHLALSKSSRQFVRECEDIGGHMLAFDCEPKAMTAACLESVLKKIDTKEQPTRDNGQSTSPASLYLDHITLPTPLSSVLSVQNLAWHKFIGGMEFIDVMKCGSSKAQLLRIAPAIKTPDHSHKGLEVTLILDGAFHDETGDYHVGDLIVEDETTTHAPVSCPRQGCVCLTVTTAPIKLTGWMGTLINPFLR